MDPAQLTKFEQLANQALTGHGQSRDEAERQLSFLSTNAECIPQLQHILEGSLSPIAQYFAANALIKLVTAFWNNYTVPQRLEIRNYGLNFLAQKGIFSHTLSF